MSKFQPSVYQQGIYDFITNGQGNAVVSAVAGSGKTTTLINALNLIPSELNVLFLAFNKSIAQELSERVPKSATNIEVKTLHAYGYLSLKKSRKSEIDNSKYKKILNDILSYSVIFDLEFLKKYNFKPSQIKMVDDFLFDDSEKELIGDKVPYFSRVQKLSELGRLNLVDLKNQDLGIEQLRELALKHNVEIINGECYRAWLLIKLGASYLDKADFTDMVFLPNHLNLQTQKYDIVFVDECQDLNACQRELMKKAIKPNTGRFIGVGDEKQAIYGFAGADSDSFQKLIDIPNTITLPLSVCYRCGTDIIDYAKKIVPTIEASPNAKKGLINLDASYKYITKGDMVVCRNTMPLVSLCMKYLSQGIKAYVMGTDISASLITMIENCRKKTEKFSCENVFARIYAEKDKLVKNIMSKEKCTEQEANENTLIISFTDKIHTLETLSRGCLTGDDLIAKLKIIFSDDSEGICLSTIHKSKGLEADRVFIIHEDLMPSKHAKKDWEKLQEQNLMYVAYTRAKSVLGFVTDFDAYSDHESQQNNIVIKEGGFVGIVGEKHRAKLKIVTMKETPNSYSNKPNYFYEMVDNNGNLFSKWGFIAERFHIKYNEELENNPQIEIGSIIEFNATIKAHKEFKGVKTNEISTISK
jgi:DNA helicase-2/ATP-dependent DNA helicase PcrA